MAGGGRPEPGSRRRARAASAVVSLPQTNAGDRLDLARLVPSGRSLLLAFCLLGAGFLAYWGARSSSVFAVQRIEVRGAPPALGREIERATRDAIGTSLLALDTSTIEGRVRGLPSIAAASVDRGFPHTLIVRVAPVRAVGVVRRAGDAWTMSGSNRVIRAIDPQAERGLPRVWLPKKLEVEVGQPLPTRYEAVARTLSGLREIHLPGRAKAVRLTGEGELVVVLVYGPEILLGSPSDLLVKLAVARRVIPLVRGGMPYLDVSVPERPVATATFNSQVEN
jgi:cell division protein FtsQ